MKVAVLALIAVMASCPAQAALAPAELESVAASPPADARLPLALAFTDAGGNRRALGDAFGATPAVLVFADYTCHNLCGPIVSLVAAALDRTGLAPSRDFHLVLVGIDPKDGPAEAQAMVAARIGAGTPLAAATTALTGDAAATQAATRPLGYRFAYDAEHDQYAHPAAAYVLSRDGRVARVLSPLTLDGDALRLALVEAGRGEVGSLIEQVTLRCFGFAAAHGIYSATILRWLAFAAVASALVLFGAVAAMALKHDWFKRNGHAPQHLSPLPIWGEVGARSVPGEGVTAQLIGPTPPHLNPLPDGERERAVPVARASNQTVHALAPEKRA